MKSFGSRVFRSLIIMLLCMVFLHNFLGIIAEEYQLHKPGFCASWCLVCVLDICGYLLRGKAPLFFED